jgi:putative aldouronate transport system substrate-binding protein
MKRIALLVMAVLFLGGGVFAAGGREQAAGGTAEGSIGTAGNPVRIRFLQKDLDPVADKDTVAGLKQTVEKAMAAQGKYIILDVLSAPAGNYNTTVPIAFRTGQVTPDVVYFQGGDLPIAQEGMLVDLTSYIAGSTNVKAIMEDHNRAAMGNYPYLLWLSPPRIQVPVIRQDHFQRLRTAQAVINDPTVDNYYAMFKEMKDTGLARWPITTDGGIEKLNTVFNHAFGITATIMRQNGKWVYSQATDQEKNKLEFYAKLYKEGLLDNEYVTKQWDTMEQAFYEGVAGWVAGTAGGVIDIYDNKMFETQKTHLVVLPPAKGVSQAYKSLDVSKESRGFAINADSKVKDAAWAFMEFMAGPQGRVIDKLGLEGIHYNIVNGRYALTPQYPSWWARVWETFNGLDVSKVDGALMTKAGSDSLAIVKQYYAPDTNVVLPENLIPLKDAMDKLYTQYSTDIIRGVRPITDFAEFVTRWNQAGGDQISAYLATVLK